MEVNNCLEAMRVLWKSVLVASLTVSLPALEIIAHRGASYDAPENSLSAMKLAWEQGADAIETDIHLSKDRQIVVMHDSTTKRTGQIDRKISESAWAEIQDLEIGAWKGATFKGERIPLLDAIFATIPKGKSIFTEIKSSEPEILDVLGKVMVQSGKEPSQLRIITFSYQMARAAKEKFPQHPVFWLLDWKPAEGTTEYPRLSTLIAKAREAKLDGLDLNHRFPIHREFVKEIHRAGLKLYTWTVDDATVAKAHAAAGVDGITTNRPQWLREQLGK